ncbi:transporter substrate-binding domain-containing protein [Pseudomonas sp. MAP12]|uniref:Transporter substrate-binding domain-containing protein n=1 Tax=Geopseudomonas aromaticivorans TaxID=2849492 RepID=A0ABS6N1V5_9GAMM|nr:transporter substrate-binding domain-containing protein [Pseudomonas aromaticivorans]MBV2135029.1 transporter substrate-binding domain-containing protein [Pseudomonas aromaticivorans]
MPELLVPACLDPLRPPREGVPGRNPATVRLAVGVLLMLLVFGIGLVGAGRLWPRAVHPSELPPGPLLEAARERGKLLIGVRAYARPALPGTPAVVEPDLVDAALAQALGEYLHLKVQLVGLPAGQRDQALQAGRVDLLVAGVAERPLAGANAALPASARHGEGQLLALRSFAGGGAAKLRGQTVCLAEGSPYRHALSAQQGAVARSYPSAVHAIAAFMAGECAALAEEASLVDWLLLQPDWRFYRRLPVTLQPSIAGHVQLPRAEPQTVAWLNAALHHWQRRAAHDAALARWIGELSVDVIKLEDGLICH